MSADIVTVRMVGLPLAVAAEAREHFDELSREFALLAERDQSLEHEIPGRLLKLSADLRDRFSSFTAGNEALLEQAMSRGEESIDLSYDVPRIAGEAAAELGVLLDEADAYCRAGDYLLTLQSPPAVIRYRRWYLDQFRSQAAGGRPVAFDDWVDAAD